MDGLRPSRRRQETRPGDDAHGVVEVNAISARSTLDALGVEILPRVCSSLTFFLTLFLLGRPARYEAGLGWSW